MVLWLVPDAGLVGVRMRGVFVGSTATFRHCVVEKVSFVFLNQCDLLLTIFATYLGFYEVNPLMRYLLTVPLLLVIMKLAIPLFIAWLAPGKLLIPSIILLLLLVGWNVKELLLFLF